MAAEGDLVLCGEAAGLEFGIEALVGERHADAPAIRAEPAVLCADEFVEGAGHGGLLAGRCRSARWALHQPDRPGDCAARTHIPVCDPRPEIGRASCRESVWTYV